MSVCQHVRVYRTNYMHERAVVVIITYLACIERGILATTQYKVRDIHMFCIMHSATSIHLHVLAFEQKFMYKI